MGTRINHTMEHFFFEKKNTKNIKALQFRIHWNKTTKIETNKKTRETNEKLWWKKKPYGIIINATG